jgi:hypothetical protein
VKITYDARTETLTLVLKPSPVVESDEEKPGMILDYDAAGERVYLVQVFVDVGRTIACLTHSGDRPAVLKIRSWVSRG